MTTVSVVRRKRRPPPWTSLRAPRTQKFGHSLSDQRRSAIDARTRRYPGYAVSQTIRTRIEEHFGWGKTIGRIRQTVCRGLRRVDQQFKLTMTASNVTRMARVLSAVPQGAMT